LEEVPGLSQFDAEEVLDTFDLPEGMPSLRNMFRGDPGAWHIDAVWAGTSADQPLSLQALRGTQTTMTRTVTTTLTSEPTTALTAELPEGRDATVTLEGDELFLMHEWPWRLEGLPFELGYGGTVTLVTLDRAGHPISRQAFVQVRGGEPTWTDEDTVITWRVTMTYEDPEERTLTAWYRAKPPHMLIRYDDGEVSYVLRATDEISAGELDDLLH
jgi:hypothetical protein